MCLQQILMLYLKQIECPMHDQIKNLFATQLKPEVIHRSRTPPPVLLSRVCEHSSTSGSVNISRGRSIKMQPKEAKKNERATVTVNWVNQNNVLAHKILDWSMSVTIMQLKFQTRKFAPGGVCYCRCGAWRPATRGSALQGSRSLVVLQLIRYTLFRSRAWCACVGAIPQQTLQPDSASCPPRCARASSLPTATAPAPL